MLSPTLVRPSPRVFRVDPPRATPVERITVVPALSVEQRSAAAQLIGQRYAWRGYHAVGLPDEPQARRRTLVAVDACNVLGTITVGIDGAEGLNCEQLFAAPVAALRSRGHRLCEFTRLAVDAADASRQVLAALFHAAYLLAWRSAALDRLLIEVHPRHARFYERRFGAEVLGFDDHHPGVGAPAVLLTMALAEVEGRLRWSEAGDRRATGGLGPLPSWGDGAGAPPSWPDGLGLPPPFSAAASARARSAPEWRS